MDSNRRSSLGSPKALSRSDVGTSEDGAFWLAFLRSLSARGLGGVKLVVSGAHQGLRGAIAAVFGEASWQRRCTHFMTNLLTRVPRRAQSWVATMVYTIYQQPSPKQIHAQLERVPSVMSPLYWTRPAPTSWPSPTSLPPLEKDLV